MTAHQQALLRLDATERLLVAELDGHTVKRLPLKGLVGHPLDYLDFLAWMTDEATSEWKAHLRRLRLKHVRSVVRA